MINKKYRREFQNKVYRYKQRKDRQRSGRMLTVPKLFPSFGRSGGDVTQIIVFAAIGNGFQVFAISSVSDANTGDLALLCHIYCLLFLYNGIVGKLIPGDSSTLFDKPDNPLCIGISLRDLVQCIFNEIMICHFSLFTKTE